VVVEDLPVTTPTYVVTDYWDADYAHRPYTSALHTPGTDGHMDRAAALHDAIEAAGAVDGDEIEIIVRKTGNRPFGNRRMRLTRPHTYEREEREPLRCDKACGASGIDPCGAAPVYECVCPRCSREPSDERFHCCEAHLGEAGERHASIRERGAIWTRMESEGRR
jgi:hypothetical protein